MLALEPPGNVARDLALFRRSLFSELGEASCFLLPEVAPLAFARRDSRPLPSRPAIRRFLREAWEGTTEEVFTSGALIASRDLLYLELQGPLATLAAKARASLKSLSLMESETAPLEAGRGFFVGRSKGPGREIRAIESPPRVSFRDCSLVLLALRCGGDPFAAAAWRELAREKRRTGPSRTPSLRRRR
jgi:hypothetical protein